MNSDIMETFLYRLDRRVNFENCKVILLLDDATCHSERLQNGLTNIKLVFLPKNTTSPIQPLNAGIIRNFKLEYRELLLCFVNSRVNDIKTASPPSDIMAKNDLEECYSRNHQHLLPKVWF